MARRNPEAAGLFLVFGLLAACGTGPSGVDGGPDGSMIPTDCIESNTVALVPGEVAQFRGTAAGLFCVRADAVGEEYVIVTSAGRTAPTTFTIMATGTVPAGGPPLPAPPQTGSGGPFESHDRADHLPDAGFHSELRALEERELGSRIRPTGGAPFPSPDDPLAPSAPASAPSEGALLTLNAQARDACALPIQVTGRVEVVSQRAIVVSDLANPAGGFTNDEYRHLAATFDTLVAPLAEQTFGAPSDIDRNGRIVLLFTREVNRLTASRAQTFTAGYFFSRDLFPRQAPPGSRLSSCPTSNEAEILYLLVPDPAGTVNGNVQEKAFVDRIMPATLIHEYQHLINASRRLHVHAWAPSQGWSEEVWLNEALSHIAEELLFYRASGLSPGSNIGPQTLQQTPGNRGVMAMNRHQVFNLLRFHEFLSGPEETSPFGVQDGLATRGAAWSFLRYVADRTGGDPAALFHTLVNAPARGIPNLAGAVGGDATFYEWLGDWSVAIYADERVAGLEPRHRDRSWRHPALHASLVPGRPYPVRTHALAPGTARTQQLVGGGTAYFRLAVEAGNTGRIQVLSGGGAPPDPLRVMLLRTK